MRFWIVVGLAIASLLIVSFVRERREQAFVASLPQSTKITGAFTPREGVAEAKRIAKLWDDECFLHGILIAYAGDDDNRGVSFEGRPIPPCGWYFRFVSIPRRRILMLRLTPDGHCVAESADGINFLDSQPLPDNFIDSTEAFQIAEERFGRDFRQDKDVFRIYAQVTTLPSLVGGPEDPVPNRPTWQIHYLTTHLNSSGKMRTDLCLMIDAVTGEVLTAQKQSNLHGSIDVEVEVIHNAFEDDD